MDQPQINDLAQRFLTPAVSAPGGTAFRGRGFHDFANGLLKARSADVHERVAIHLHSTRVLEDLKAAARDLEGSDLAAKIRDLVARPVPPERDPAFQVPQLDESTVGRLCQDLFQPDLSDPGSGSYLAQPDRLEAFVHRVFDLAVTRACDDVGALPQASRVMAGLRAMIRGGAGHEALVTQACRIASDTPEPERAGARAQRRTPSA